MKNYLSLKEIPIGTDSNSALPLKIDTTSGDISIGNNEEIEPLLNTYWLEYHNNGSNIILDYDNSLTVSYTKNSSNIKFTIYFNTSTRKKFTIEIWQNSATIQALKKYLNYTNITNSLELNLTDCDHILIRLFKYSEVEIN